jgi:predicted DNA-binding transcriptional regulator YafY
VSGERIEGRTLRLWVIMQAMFEHAHVGVTLQMLEELTGRSRSTIWRDLNLLARAGVAYEEDNDDEGRKRLRLPKASLPRLLLMPKHMLAITVARRTLSALEGTSMLDAYDDILSRIGRPAPRADLSPEEVQLVAYRRMVEQGFERGVRLRILYLNVGQTAPRPREIDPLAWQWVRDEVYLLAFDHGARAPRSFATTRLRGVEVTDAPVSTPPSPAERPWFRLSDDLDSLPAYRVTLELSPVAFAQLPSRPLNGSQRLEPRPDGTAVLTAQVAGLWKTAEWISSWGADVRPLHPPELVEMMRDWARRCAAAWGA